MSLIEVAEVIEQIGELGAAVASCLPVYARVRAGPVSGGEYRQQHLTEGPVEVGLMGSNQYRIFEEGRDVLGVDSLAGYHLGGDASELGHIVRYGDTRFTEAFKLIHHFEHPS